LTIRESVHALAVYDLARDVLTPIMSTESSQFGVWHPNGRDIIYRGTRAGYRNIFRRAADGSGGELRLTTSEGLQSPLSVSSDEWLLYYDVAPDTGFNLWGIELGAEKQEPQEFLVTAEGAAAAHFSPDGRSVAYQSLVPGSFEVSIRPFPEGEPRVLVGVGQSPQWSRDGRELFYLSEEGNTLMVVDVEGSGREISVGSPRVLLSGWPGMIGTASGADFDVSADGRFLTFVPLEPSSPTMAVDVVLNWTSELQRLVPAD
jgi:Tol biopolymer transport system component